MMGKVAKFGWGFLAVVMLVATWATCTGRVWLQGLELERVEELTAAKQLLAGRPPLGGLHLGLLGGDIFWWDTFLKASLTVLALAMGLVVFRKLWQNPVSPMLAVGSLVFGSTTSWLSCESSLAGAEHILEVACLGALLLGKVAFLSALVPALCALNPAAGLALYPALVYLALRRHQAYGVLVTAGAVVGVGALLVPMAGNYQMVPSLSGLSLWSLLPLLLLLWPEELRRERRGFYLSLLGGAVLTGRPELASAVALGDFALVMLKRIGTASSKKTAPESSWTLRTSTLFQVTALAVFIMVVLPGEHILNRQVLIPAQRKHIPFTQLFRVFSLEEHAAKLASQDWRKAAPYPQLRESDLGPLKNLPKERAFTPLTVGEGAEDRMRSLLYAHLGNRPLGGWDDPQHLAGPMLLCKRRGKNFVVDGPAILFLREGSAEIALGPDRADLPGEENDGRLDFRRLINVPHRPQTVSAEPNCGYLWVANQKPYTLFFAEQPAEVVFGVSPGKVKLLALNDEKNERELTVHPTDWVLEYLGSQEVLPSRSLVPMNMVLLNRGAGAVSTDGLEAIRLETKGTASFSPFQQELGEEFILFPGESINLTLTLATPEPEGTFQIEAFALTPQGQELPLPILGTRAVKTWRRLSPVGTWVEEP